MTTRLSCAVLSLILGASSARGDKTTDDAPRKDVGELPEDLQKKAREVAGGEVTVPGLMVFTGVVVFMVFAFGVGALFGLAWLTSKWPQSPENSTRAYQMYALIIIVDLAVALPAAGFSGSQIAPIYGLLGTALGFVFGKGTAAPKTPEAPPGEPPPAS
jgi:hypothetical protein